MTIDMVRVYTVTSSRCRHNVSLHYPSPRGQPPSSTSFLPASKPTLRHGVNCQNRRAPIPATTNPPYASQTRSRQSAQQLSLWRIVTCRQPLLAPTNHPNLVEYCRLSSPVCIWIMSTNHVTCPGHVISVRVMWHVADNFHQVECSDFKHTEI